ncbi:MAG TPA: hypothetical protein VMV10_20820 [Pirellulales bacterium]|nr:hypothetical protein [Pirellulales bacterium]
MSYDLTIRANESFSAFAQCKPLAKFMRRLPHLKPFGERCFVLDDPPRRRMEIDLELVNEAGDILDDEAYAEFNCVRLHIPQEFLSASFQRDYFPTALAIAERLGWQLFDAQTEQAITHCSEKPWWKFWG